MAQPSILICTVGGSHQPIIKGISQHLPHFVHFLCSDDIGKVKGSYIQVIGEGKILKSDKDLDKPDLPNIATLANLPDEKYSVYKIQNFDDLNACYLKTMRVIAEARKHWPNARIVVDYTGGTKSMTAGLAAAALDDGCCDISLVAGQRNDLVAVQNLTEFVRPVHVWDAQALRRIQAARELLTRYDYAGAEQILRDAAARFAGDHTLQTLQRGIALCCAFDAWDKFRHADARSLLRPYQGQFVPWWRVLGVLAGESRGHGFECVEDLLRNAERRASQERFDDAIGQMYRAVELTAQVWLESVRGIDTSNVNMELVPETFHVEVKSCRDHKGIVKIGLLKAWDLIAAVPEDALGQRFILRRHHVLSFLAVRNDSLFAHGRRPVSQIDYNEHAPIIISFLSDCIDAAIEACKAPRPVELDQLPSHFLDDREIGQADAEF